MYVLCSIRSELICEMETKKRMQGIRAISNGTMQFYEKGEEERRRLRDMSFRFVFFLAGGDQ